MRLENVRIVPVNQAELQLLLPICLNVVLCIAATWRLSVTLYVPMFPSSRKVRRCCLITSHRDRVIPYMRLKGAVWRTVPFHTLHPASLPRVAAPAPLWSATRGDLIKRVADTRRRPALHPPTAIVLSEAVPPFLLPCPNPLLRRVHTPPPQRCAE